MGFLGRYSDDLFIDRRYWKFREEVEFEGCVFRRYLFRSFRYFVSFFRFFLYSIYFL